MKKKDVWLISDIQINLSKINCRKCHGKKGKKTMPRQDPDLTLEHMLCHELLHNDQQTIWIVHELFELMINECDTYFFAHGSTSNSSIYILLQMQALFTIDSSLMITLIKSKKLNGTGESIFKKVQTHCFIENLDVIFERT